MSSVIIQRPTKEILALCDDADSLIERYLGCFRACLDKPGWRVGRCRFEAEAEAYTILKLLIRHLESVCQLARHDLVLLPSAIVSLAQSLRPVFASDGCSAQLTHISERCGGFCIFVLG